jgi:putative two-component system response regulator
VSKTRLDSQHHARYSSRNGENAAQAGAGDVLDVLADVAAQPTLELALRTVRETLGMEVAYTAEIVGDDFVVRELDGDGESFGYARGLATPRRHTHCERMLAGRIPNLIPDVLADDRTASLPITQTRRLGAFATVPLSFADGRLYGTLCAASHDPKSFDYRQLQFMKVLARLIADQLERVQASDALGERTALVDAAADAVIGTTPSGVVTSWNAAGERMFGCPRSEALGRDIVELIATPENRQELAQAVRSAAAGEAVRVGGERQRADGAPLFDAIKLSPVLDPLGHIRSLSALVSDVSDAVYQGHYRMVEREVVSSMSSASDATEATLGMLRGLGEGLDCQIGVLWELDESRRRLAYSALWATQPARDEAFVQGLHEGSFARGEGLPGRAWAEDSSQWLQGLDRLPEARMQMASASGLKTAVAVPLRLAGEVAGVVEFFSANATAENAEMLAMGEAIVGRLADALARHRAQQALREMNLALEVRVRQRTNELEDVVAELHAAQSEIVGRLSRAVEFRDGDTGAHIGRISYFAARIARRAGLDAKQCDLIERASPLHDVGKVAIPDSILLKPGRLTPAERAVIETHTEIGHRLLSASDFPVLQLAAVIALTHHERYDGTGYPHGLAGEDIPLEGRIVAIADVFDALTSDRVYRRAMTVEQAIAILRDGQGTHFDRALLDYFLADLAERARAA